MPHATGKFTLQRGSPVPDKRDRRNGCARAKQTDRSLCVINIQVGLALRAIFTPDIPATSQSSG
jgi:hypothetical protein